MYSVAVDPSGLVPVWNQEELEKKVTDQPETSSLAHARRAPLTVSWYYVRLLTSLRMANQYLSSTA